MTKFYWQDSSIQELALHIHSATTNSVKQQLNYYKLVDNKDMILKIIQAKKLNKLWKLEEEVKKLKEELYG